MLPAVSRGWSLLAAAATCAAAAAAEQPQDDCPVAKSLSLLQSAAVKARIAGPRLILSAAGGGDSAGGAAAVPFHLQHQGAHPERFTPIETAVAVGGRAESAGQAAGGAVKVIMYAINEEHRADRRECIASQLAGSPYPANIAAAANLSTFKDLCPGLDWAGAIMDVPAARAILCSNFLVWQHAALHGGGADFVVVFEDDVILAPGIWHQVGELLAGQCQDFDYIAVDTFKATAAVKKSPVPADQGPLCPGTPLYPLAGAGAQMQIFRASALHRIIEHVSSASRLRPVDKLFMGDPQGIRARCWQPDLVQQFGRAATSDADRNATGCNMSVKESLHWHVLAQDRDAGSEPSA